MKKYLVFFFLSIFVIPMAFAADGAEMYKASCAGCHGADGGKSAGGTAPLKGQKPDAVLKMLQGYADGSFGGKQKAVMENVVKKLSPQELETLSTYIGTL